MTCFRLTFLVALTACCSIVAAFNGAAKSNVVVYYGQGNNQKRLSTYCADSSIDIIILSFVHLFPQQANGYPGINFGNQCSGDRYAGPGAGVQADSSKDSLLKCPDLQKDVQVCRHANKKILLSLGGATPDYQLSGQLDGANFATQLWGMFGPRQNSWVAQGLPRPFDDGNVEFSVDGFDLDIEHAPTDNFAGYKALVTKLRALYAAEHRPYYLTASPQCVVPDANMGEILKAGTFDMVFVQFYNTPECSARRWVEANRNFVPGGSVDTAGLTFDGWASFLANTQYSREARIYVGLPGSPGAANPGFDISSAQARSLAAAYYCRPNFGGISVWEATAAAANMENGRNFFQNAKESLRALATDRRLSCGASSSADPPEEPPSEESPPLPQEPSSSPPQSTDGRCGDGFGTTCGNSLCCSKWSWCGTDPDHCGTGCQGGFGRCG